MPIGPNDHQFDFENAVREGIVTDSNTNDKHIEAKTLQVSLGDSGGVEEFRILDSDNVAIVVADSDGYLAIAGNAEVRGGHILVRGESQVNTPFISLEDEVSGVDLYLFNDNPDGAVSAQMGSFGTNYNDGYVYINADGSTNWQRLAYASQITTATTSLHQAYKNDVDGGDATITTDATDGDVIITGTEQFVVTADGGVNVNTIGSVTIAADANSSISVDGANLTFEITTSGDIINRLSAPGADFVIDQGAGSEYLRAETSANELRLGDLSPTEIDVRVLSDLIVDGDFTVNGTTTFVNTENLYVEDRLLRLNVGTAPLFSGTTGIEMEVGSDGYVEFHWDDTQSRWEVSIDRNATPEAQTFRPLPYLADSPTTLDLSAIGTGGFPTPGPNPDSGAAVINTNLTNFPYTFGAYMQDDSVQAALEAIDAYFIDMTAYVQSSSTSTTLHQAYKNDSDGANATITTDSADGNVIIAGTEQFVVTASGGVDINTAGAVSLDSTSASNFTVAGNNLTLSTSTSGDVIVNSAATVDVDGVNVTIDASSSVSIDAAAPSNFTTSAGAITVDGAGGIVLQGNGNDVIPGTTNLDTLGNASFGWADVYVENVSSTAVVAIRAAGGATAPNTTAGAHVIGTSPSNFGTFGPDMTDNSVQAALEAIDGYLIYLSNTVSIPTTLQIAYDNDSNGGDAAITTNATDGSVVIAGTESLWVTAAGGINLDAGFDMDSTSSFDVNVTGAGFYLDAYNAASNVTVDNADLFVGTTTSGVLTLSGSGGIVLNGTGDHVRPADDRVNYLGRSDAGWADVYLANVVGNATVALRSAGGSAAPNVTSGAHAVGTNATNFITFGPDMTDNSVQAALEAIDGYLHDLSLEGMDTVYTKKVGLDINGGILNGVVKITTVAGTPGLEFKQSGTSRASWTIPVPSDWDSTSDFTVTTIWSPADASAGNVEWRLEYKVLALTELASTAATNVDYLQAAGGTLDALQSTGNNLIIPASAIQTTDSLIVINLVRRGGAGTDTYNDNAQVHLVHYNYNAQNIV